MRTLYFSTYIYLRQSTKSLLAVMKFLITPSVSLSFFQRVSLINRYFAIDRHIECQHYNYEIIEMTQTILAIPKAKKGVLVEAGAFKGGSTAKLSVLAKILGRKLIVFDSFEGLPSNTDMYTSREGLFFIYKKPSKKIKHLYVFPKGKYKGSIQEVKRNIALYGCPEVCIFKKGFFKKTMKSFNTPIASLFIDVDLASSTKTCLTYLYPLLQPGGVLFSHDGHLSHVIDVYKDQKFWLKYVGIKRPTIYGLDKRRLLKIIKPE